MLREDLEAVKANARLIAKEEIAAIPKPDDPMKGIDVLIKKLISEAISPLSERIGKIEKELRALKKPQRGGK